MKKIKMKKLKYFPLKHKNVEQDWVKIISELYIAIYVQSLVWHYYVAGTSLTINYYHKDLKCALKLIFPVFHFDCV